MCPESGSASEIRGENTRSTRRYRVLLPCVFRHDGRDWKGRLKDLSIDGGFVESETLPSRGSMVKLSFVPESGLDVEVLARVMYKSALSPERAGFGLYFTEFKGNSLRRLDRYLSSLSE